MDYNLPQAAENVNSFDWSILESLLVRVKDTNPVVCFFCSFNLRCHSNGGYLLCYRTLFVPFVMLCSSFILPFVFYFFLLPFPADS